MICWSPTGSDGIISLKVSNSLLVAKFLTIGKPVDAVLSYIIWNLANFCSAFFKVDLFAVFVVLKINSCKLPRTFAFIISVAAYRSKNSLFLKSSEP